MKVFFSLSYTQWNINYEKYRVFKMIWYKYEYYDRQNYFSRYLMFQLMSNICYIAIHVYQIYYKWGFLSSFLFLLVFGNNLFHQ